MIKTHPIIEAVRQLLDKQIRGTPVTVDVGTLGSPSITIELVDSPRFEHYSLGGPDRASVLIQITVRADDLTEARLFGDHVRERLAGVDRKNRRLHPIPVNGYVVDDVTATDGHAENNGNIPTWVERYTIHYQNN